MQRRFPQGQRASHGRPVLMFLAVGGATAVLYGIVFAVLWERVSLGRTAAVSIAYASAVLFHFLMNRRFTFNRHGSALGTHAVRYVVMVVMNYGITLAAVEIAVSGLSMSSYGGIVLGIGATFLTGYLLSRYWVFRP